MAIKIKGQKVITDDEDLTIDGTITAGNANSNEHEIHGSLTLISNLDATASNTTGTLRIGGPTGDNLGIDANEIQARNSGTPDTLYLNNEGGNINMCDNRVTFQDDPANEQTSLFLYNTTPAIELHSTVPGGTPFIDFKDDTGDYDMRLIRTGNNTLDVRGGNLDILDGQYKQNGVGVPVFVNGTSTLNSNTNSSIISYGVTFASKPAIQGYLFQPGGYPNNCGEYNSWSSCYEGGEKFGPSTTVEYGYHYWDITETGFKWENEMGYQFTLYWTAIGLLA